jgi:hypothetical protein
MSDDYKDPDLDSLTPEQREKIRKFDETFPENPFHDRISRYFGSQSKGGTALTPGTPGGQQGTPQSNQAQSNQGYIQKRLQQVYGPPAKGVIVPAPSGGKGTHSTPSSQPVLGGDGIECRFEETQARVPDFSALQRNPTVRGSDTYVELRRKRFGEVQFEAFVRNVEPEVAARMLGLRDDEWA